MSVENSVCPFLQGIGCYMFHINSDEVVDATMSGNEARFINHACEVSVGRAWMVSHQPVCLNISVYW